MTIRIEHLVEKSLRRGVGLVVVLPGLWVTTLWAQSTCQVGPAASRAAIQQCIDQGGVVILAPGDYHQLEAEPYATAGFNIGTQGKDVEIVGEVGADGQRPRIHGGAIPFRYGRWDSYGLESQGMRRLIIRNLELVNPGMTGVPALEKSRLGIALSPYFPLETTIDNCRIAVTSDLDNANWFSWAIWFRWLSSSGDPIATTVRVTDNEIIGTNVMGAIALANFYNQRAPRFVVSGNHIQVENLFDPRPLATGVAVTGSITTHGNVSEAVFSNNTIAGWGPTAGYAKTAAFSFVRSGALTTTSMMVTGNNMASFTGDHQVFADTVVTNSYFGAYEAAGFSGNIIGQISADGVAAVVDFGHHNFFVRNDFTQSGIRGKKDGQQVCVALGAQTHDDVVFESGRFPVGTGGATHQVTDLGTNNRIVGHPAGSLAHPVDAGVARRLRALETELIDAGGYEW